MNKEMFDIENAKRLTEIFQDMPVGDPQEEQKQRRKKRIENTPEDLSNEVSQLQKDINKKYGADVLICAKEVVDKPRKVISATPVLDFALKGIPEGSWVLLSGSPKCGKTTTALQIAANAQNQFGKEIFYGNVEHRVDKKALHGINGLHVDDIHIIQSQKKKILMAQDFLQEFTNIIKTIPGCVLIIDSTSALCAEKEYTEDITSQARNEGPKLLATFCRKMAAIVPVQDVTLIIIQHLIANTSGYGSPFYEDGGNKIQYQADIKLRCTSWQKWLLKPADESTRVGQVVNWQIVTSALGPPGGKVQSYIRYGYGIDDIKEYIGLGLDMAIIEKGGAWYTFGDLKAHGEEKMRDALIENPGQLKKLKDLVNEHIQ